MERKKIVAGNWKMNMNLFEGKQLIADILTCEASLNENTLIIIAPPFTQLELAASQIKDHPNYYLAAQNCHQQKSGAFTGEISAAMLKSVGVSYVIIGHSERRQYFNENDELLALKTNAALDEKLDVIFCLGEPLHVREENKHNEYVRQQLVGGLFHLDENQFRKIVIAYEPVWAIGTGRTASAEQAQDMHAFIRNIIAEKYGNDLADSTTILYGGSCNPGNATELFACPDIDGGLIGGASLKSQDFCSIIKAR